MTSPTTKTLPNSEYSTTPAGDDLAVVVCAYTDERWEDIVAAMTSLRSQSTPAGELILVIDHNEPLFERAKAELDIDGGQTITIVQNTHKRGLSGARNSGIEASSRPIIGFLDDDAVADVNWIQQLLIPYADSNVVGVGGNIKPIWLAGRPKWFPPEFDWVVGCIYKGHTTKTTQVRNAIGANMSVRRHVFEEVGGFSSGLGRIGKRPVGAEETELYIRIQHLHPNTKVIYEPTASVEHKVPGSRGSVGYFLRRCYAEGLSKAVVSRISFSNENLSSEWNYTLKTLPLGVLVGIKDALKGDPSGLSRSLAIVSGLTITVAGYLRGRMARGPKRNLTSVLNSSEPS